MDGRRDKTSCEDDDSQRELINPNPNPVSDYNTVGVGKFSEIKHTLFAGIYYVARILLLPT
jgi:hypothetical protein